MRSDEGARCKGADCFVRAIFTVYKDDRKQEAEMEGTGQIKAKEKDK